MVDKREEEEWDRKEKMVVYECEMGIESLSSRKFVREVEKT